MIAIGMALILAGQSASEPLPEISDAALVALARTPFDPYSDPGKWPRVLGMHRGVKVVVRYVCSDLCPDYTRRIIEYAQPAEKTCADMGGVYKSLTVPDGMGMEKRPYCVPAVTAPYQN